MAVITLPQSAQEPDPRARVPQAGFMHSNPSGQPDDALNLTRIAAGGTLLAAGLLFLAGRYRAGTVTAAAGTALALLDQQDAVRTGWTMLPRYITDVQRLVADVQVAVEDVSTKREKLRRFFTR